MKLEGSPIQHFAKFLRGGLAVAMAIVLTACVGKPDPTTGRVTVRYWEKWVGFEADAMRVVVDDFNASQDRIFVDYSSVSQMDRRLMLAISGGVPPDVAGVVGKGLPAYAENNALIPLDRSGPAPWHRARAVHRRDLGHLHVPRPPVGPADHPRVPGVDLEQENVPRRRSRPGAAAALHRGA